MTEDRPLEFCRVCKLWRRFAVFAQNGFAFKACQRCGDAGAIPKEEAS
jgi:hypothetical protein